jgi:hypothetical protein
MLYWARGCACRRTVIRMLRPSSRAADVCERDGRLEAAARARAPLSLAMLTAEGVQAAVVVTHIHDRATSGGRGLDLLAGGRTPSQCASAALDTVYSRVAVLRHADGATRARAHEVFAHEPWAVRRPNLAAGLVGPHSRAVGSVDGEQLIVQRAHEDEPTGGVDGATRRNLRTA